MQNIRVGWLRQKATLVGVLIAMGRARSADGRGDFAGALSLVQMANPSTAYEAVRRSYIARLMLISRVTGVLIYVNDLATYLEETDRKLLYAEYCRRYCAYLKCVILAPEVSQAIGEKVGTADSTPFIRGTLFVT